MPKKCNICGMIKKTTFNCGKCGNRICLNCYDFKSGLCYVCLNANYNEKYKQKISEYENGKRAISI